MSRKEKVIGALWGLAVVWFATDTTRQFGGWLGLEGMSATLVGLPLGVVLAVGAALLGWRARRRGKQ